jgi:hypothetical protein
MSFAKPLTELTNIWLDNVMDDVPPGDVTVKASAKTLSSYFVVFAYIAYNLAQS